MFAALFTAGALVASSPAIADLTLGTAAPVGGQPASRSTDEGRNYAAQVVTVSNNGNNVVNRGSLNIQAVRRNPNTGALLETLPLKEVFCQTDNQRVTCPSITGAIVNGRFHYVFDVLAPQAQVNFVVVFPTPISNDGVVTVEATIKVNSSKGRAAQLSASISPLVFLERVAFSAAGYIPRTGGQVTAQGLDPKETSLVNALTTVVSIPENSGNSSLSNRFGKIVHGVDPNSCSPMWSVCLHSSISIPDAVTAATFSKDDPLKVVVKIDASAFNNGASFGNVVVQYKSTPDAAAVDLIPCDGDFSTPKLPIDTSRCYLKDDKTTNSGGTLTGFGQIVVLEQQNGLLLFR